MAALLCDAGLEAGCDEQGGDGAQPPWVVFCDPSNKGQVKSDPFGGIMSVLSKLPRKTVFM